MSRPFFNDSIAKLEVDFENPNTDQKYLALLLDELSYRSTDRAKKLKLRVLAKMEATATTPPPEQMAPISQATEQVTNNETHSRQPLSNGSGKNNPLTNKSDNILSAWIALEVLSPQTFRRPQDLAGAMGSVVDLNRQAIPWEGSGEKSKPNYRLYYQVVLGTLDYEKAVAALVNMYPDAKMERPVTKGEAILAVVVVDNKGHLVKDEAAFVSSFAWGLPHALKGELHSLSEWKESEATLNAGLDKILRRMGDEGQALPLDADAIRKARSYLTNILQIPGEFVTTNVLAVRTYQYYTNKEAPEPLFLNSFFIGDLITAKRLCKEGKASSNLQRYLALKQPGSRKDLRNDKTALEQAIAPSNMPPARWPGPGRHPLVLLQQAAVNLTLKELQTDGILAVNGPPGTGKTTLLRDIVAGIVVSRAEAMSRFDNPADAFRYSGQRLAAGQGFLTLYEIDESIKGFEILIASSNNKAVENVSVELPGRNAVSGDIDNFTYFTCLSDVLIEKESWGLIAAVLGNAANKSRFRQNFWWDKEVGLSTYLAEAAGTPQFIDVIDEKNGAVIGTKRPRIIQEEEAPSGHEEALERWVKAKARFHDAIQKSRSQLAALEKIREDVNNLPVRERENEQAKRDFDRALKNVETAKAETTTANTLHTTYETAVKRAEEDLANHRKQRPGFFARIFSTKPAQAWKSVNVELEANAKAARDNLANSAGLLKQRKESLAKAVTILGDCKKRFSTTSDKLSVVKQRVEAARRTVGNHIIDGAFFRLPHHEKQIVSPWCDKSAQRLRDDVFIEAMKLHKAFIDAAAKPLRHNLGALMTVFSGGGTTDEKKQKLLPDLWSSLFLVVPGVSTTFASVERMLGKLPPETFGWLLIDEAGQALPQAAVGALMRTKRAVVVGDPLQIEPIVTLPGSLTQNICRQFGVDPDRFNAPETSAQTLADAATSYYTEFEGHLGSRMVGVPLLVHRRCEDPMFSISNAIAYSRLMVQAKRPGNSPIRELFGTSRWIDVKGQAMEKWCPDEGMVVTDMLRRLRNKGITPDLYIITPFVVVADNLRKLILDSRILQGWIENDFAWVKERVGTVHTVQGREAEAVLFVLGAQQVQQTGARAWAGGRPNLANVAVTRAKEVLYIIGNRQLWQDAGFFKELSRQLPAG
jgi:hypothetical protein